jgi:hypothetical protein
MAAVAAAFVLIALAIYQPALRGTPASDDVLIFDNPYLRDTSVGALASWFDPRSLANVSIANYAPVQALTHVLALHVFGDATLGHHLINVVLHGVVCALFAALLAAHALPPAVARAAGLLLLVHPASVEAVAWISQTKTPLSLAFALAALLALPRRPALATALFAAGLLAKAQVAFVVPTAWTLAWAKSSRRDLAVGLLWLALGVGFAAVELPVFRGSGEYEVPALAADRGRHLLYVLAIAGRYVAMAVSLGLSTFHEPELPESLADGWVLLGLTACVGSIARAAIVLARRRVEGAYWVWLAATFAPISQVFPFLHGLADRYLYFMLPALLGAGALAAFGGASSPERRARLARGMVAAALALSAVLGWGSHERARVWRHEEAVMVDAALHYPDGIYANLLRSRQAAADGDVSRSVAALRAAHARGWNWSPILMAHPAWAGVLHHPEFRALLAELGAGLERELEGRLVLTQAEWMTLAQSRIWQQDLDGARDALRRALEQGGPLDASVRKGIEELERSRASQGGR